ncbi:MAPEG family protein [Ferrimonas balearica]|uniref:MAPEG family protein n=1 Tax=Ferrimonas balearica TaxID=44012 RepID=UPI001C99BCCA|nr:MAPEG family protein [Ferrimonas balearica]MBY5921034.1 MAPEG family protein [Ferrimonas balearica]MBY5996281.1 MAPEG family protein [Ferrimonas balearica]
MDYNASLILPLLTLVAWTLVMWLWMYATRIPAILAMKMELDPNAPAGTQMAQLPPNVRWKADNYNHLLEQPVLFYALMLALTQLGANGPLPLILAWSYVLLRIVHSLVQVLINRIEWRFVVFVLSTLPLFGLTGYGLALALVRA